jgi:hypothetical protein
MNFEMCFKMEGSVSIIVGNVYETDPRWIQVDPNPYPYRIRGSAYPAPGPDGSGNIAKWYISIYRERGNTILQKWKRQGKRRVYIYILQEKNNDTHK